MISKAVQHDITELVMLINSAYRGEESKKGWTTEADLLGGKRTDHQALKELMDRKNATIFKFCNQDNLITGCVYLEKMDRVMYLGMLTVSPVLQAQGIGKKLLFASEDYAAEQNCSVMQITVISAREELIQWYERHGYHKTGQIQPFPSGKFGIARQPLDFVVLEKKL